VSGYTKAKTVAGALPDYPGRQALEDLLRPVVEPLAKKWAGHKVQRLVGFWLMWHTMGGLEGLIASGLWSRGNLYAQRHEFHEVFGCQVEDWMPALVTALAGAPGVLPAKASA
jgi:hypothetical protein